MDDVPTDFSQVALHTNLIDRSNLMALSLVLRRLIMESDVVALDTEFTGLGISVYSSSKVGKEVDINERYLSYSKLVREYSLVSLGITLFKKVGSVGVGKREVGASQGKEGVDLTKKVVSQATALSEAGTTPAPAPVPEVKRKKTRRAIKKKKPKVGEGASLKEGSSVLPSSSVPQPTPNPSQPPPPPPQPTLNPNQTQPSLNHCQPLDSSASTFRYRASNFCLLLNNQLDYKVSPSSLSFLTKNGFDLNQLVQKGIPYLPGALGFHPESKTNGNKNPPTRLECDTSKYNLVIRGVMMEIFRSKAALVVHNGLLDIMFLYYSFYADLPASLDTFLADVSDWGNAGFGMFDTKCLAEYVSRETASYLSFLFNKSLREQAVLNSVLKSPDSPETKSLQCFSVIMQPPIKIGAVVQTSESQTDTNSTKRTATSQFLSLLDPSKNHQAELETFFCMAYMFHGHCQDHLYESSLVTNHKGCAKSHDLLGFLNGSLVLASSHYARHGAKGSNRPKLKPSPYLLDSIYVKHPDFYAKILDIAKNLFINSHQISQEDTNGSKEVNPVCTSPNMYHSAHYDSFMTGFIFLHYIHHPNPQLRLDLDAKSNKISPTKTQPPKVGSMAAMLSQLQNNQGGLIEPATNYRNYLYLMGKSTPLYIVKSTYANYSESHLKLWYLNE